MKSMRNKPALPLDVTITDSLVTEIGKTLARIDNALRSGLLLEHEVESMLLRKRQVEAAKEAFHEASGVPKHIRESR